MRPLTLLFLLALSCSDSSAPPPPPLVQMEVANLDLIAHTALHASIGLATVLGPVTGVVQKTESGLDGGFARLLLHRLLLSTAGGGTLLAVNTVTVPGPEGGSVTFDWDDRDDDGHVSTGDTFAMTFAGYGENGAVLDGMATFDQLAVQGRPDLADSNWMLTGTVSFADLVVATPNTSVVWRAAIPVYVERRLTVLLLQVLLPADVQAGDATLLAGSDMAFEHFTDETTWLAGHGWVAHAALPGVVQYQNLVPWQGFFGVPFPLTGALEVRGLNHARMTITAIDSVQVRVQTDLDGNGTIDDTRTIPWDG